MTFSEWLLGKIEESGLSYSEIGRRGHISHARISQVISGESPGADFCIGVAKGLGLSPEDVLRRAGILPSLPPEVEEQQEAIRIIRRLDPTFRDAAMSMLRGLDQYRAGIRSTATGYDLAPAADTQPQKRGATLRENERPVYDDDIPALRRLLASILVSILEHLPPDDVTTVYDTMKRYRDQRDSRGAAESVPRQP